MRSRHVAVPVIAVVTLAVVWWYAARTIGGAVRHPVVAIRLILSDAPRRLPVPVVGVRLNQLANGWDSPRPGGRLHRGIDIFAPRGRAVVSTTAGIVVTVGQRKLGGNVVRVLGPGGEWHYYAHLDRFGSVREGQIIRAGTVLGYVGDTGNARGTPPHLHYGIYRFRGGALNPYFRLVAR